MKDYYDSVSEGYNELYGEEQLKKWDISKKMVSFSKTDIVLDLGCGTGIFIPEIAKQVKMVVGIDASEGMVKKAPKPENVVYIISDAGDIPFEDNYFNKVISFTMIQDIEDWEPVLSEIKRVCRGDVILSFLKRNKNLKLVSEKIAKFFKIKEVVEEEKDFIFLLE